MTYANLSGEAGERAGEVEGQGNEEINEEGGLYRVRGMAGHYPGQYVCLPLCPRLLSEW